MIDRLPPGPALPVALQTLAMRMRQRPYLERCRRRYGPLFTVRLIGFGPAVVVSDPDLIKRTFQAHPAVLHAGSGSPLRDLLGPHSLLGTDEAEHLEQRKLLLPPFTGERMNRYGPMIAQIAADEIDSWPAEVEFASDRRLQRITLGAILRAVFGAEGAHLRSLEMLLPAWTRLGNEVALAVWLRRNYGRWSPWTQFQRLRARIDAVLDELIALARTDDRLAERADVLALLVQARHADGTRISDAEIRDQLVTMLVAGHETTGQTLTWAIERLRRHPEVLARLVGEAEGGGKTLRHATIREVQRCRPVVPFAGRLVRRRFELGGYALPVGTRVLVAACLTHYDPALFPDPHRFNPDRFLSSPPEAYSWLPFGGGIRRCLGASFAHMEMDVVLRVLLERVELVPTTAPGEEWSFRGIVWSAADGGRAVVRRPASGRLAAAETASTSA